MEMERNGMVGEISITSISASSQQFNMSMDSRSKAARWHHTNQLPARRQIQLDISHFYQHWRHSWNISAEKFEKLTSKIFKMNLPPSNGQIYADKLSTLQGSQDLQHRIVKAAKLEVHK
jgi:hypothetical protein